MRTDDLENKKAYEDFLLSEKAVPSGTYAANIQSNNTGELNIEITDQILSENDYYLVLIPSDKSVERKIIEGKINGSNVVFSFSKAANDIFGKDTIWLCYFASRTEKIFSRLKRTGKALYPKRGDRPYPSLWHDRGRYLNSLAHKEIVGTEYWLLPFFNEKRNTLSIKKEEAVSARSLCTAENLYHKEKIIKDIKKYPFEISVIMAVYMAEDYLEEAIESIVQQDIGFEENVQLVLVDDGSKDGSGAICDRYAERYPHNVTVIHKGNGGVASARNEGMKAASGKYLNFCDSDDKFSLNAFRIAKAFFDSKYDQVDVVTIPIFFFEGQEGGHWQNYKFNKGTRVINLWAEYTASDMFVNASFFKESAARKFSFEHRIATGEDLLYIAQILLEKMQLGVVTGCNYWYRRRNAGNSLVDTSRLKKSWYFNYFTCLVFFLEAYSRKKYGSVPYFIQNTIMMDMQWRFKQESFPEGLLTEREKAKYRKNIIKTINSIDDNVIAAQKKLYIEEQIQLFKMKYRNGLSVQKTCNDIAVLCRDKCLRTVGEMQTHFDFIQLEKDKVKFDGYVQIMGVEAYKQADIYLSVGNNYYLCSQIQRNIPKDNCFGNLRHVIGFKGELPITQYMYGKKIRVVVVVDGHLIIKRRYRYGKFCPVNTNFENQYYCKNGLVLKGDLTGVILDVMQMPESDYEALYEQELQASVIDNAEEELFPKPSMQEDLTEEKVQEIISLRQYAKTAEKKKPIWLVSDRWTVADDNGAALFKYLMKQKDLPADVYFVIEKDCEDYKKLSEVGPVLDYGSEEHLKKHLQADLIISSQAEEYVMTPFGRDTFYYGDRKYYSDILADHQFIFLQHGITKDDLTGWLNRYNKNITGFITAVERERDSILEYDYYYDEENVWLTGFPRFDYLYEDNKKYITICPTWRLYLKDLTEHQFINSAYFKFYMDLLDNKRLKEAIKTNGYQLCLKMHPMLQQYRELFAKDDLLILEPEDPYRQMYAESRLLITDYSSAVMDFAYLRKPVVYCQFDKDVFFEKHTMKKGYFDYERDGFGEVTYNVEETVDAIIRIIDNKCKMSEKYLERCEKFFPKRDQDNCHRVYEKLKELQK